MERCHPVTVGVPFIDQGVSGVSDPPPLGRVAETRYHFADIGEIRVETDVVLVSRQNVVVSAPYQDLAGAGSRGVEVAGGDAFGIGGAAWAVRKKAGLDFCETHRAAVEC